MSLNEKEKKSKRGGKAKKSNREEIGSITSPDRLPRIPFSFPRNELVPASMKKKEIPKNFFFKNLKISDGY